MAKSRAKSTSNARASTAAKASAIVKVTMTKPSGAKKTTVVRSKKEVASRSAAAGKMLSQASVSKKGRLEILIAQSEKVKKNPAYGIEVAKRAGILNEEGKLTAYFKIK